MNECSFHVRVESEAVDNDNTAIGFRSVDLFLHWWLHHGALCTNQPRHKFFTIQIEFVFYLAERIFRSISKSLKNICSNSLKMLCVSFIRKKWVVMGIGWRGPPPRRFVWNNKARKLNCESNCRGSNNFLMMGFYIACGAPRTPIFLFYFRIRSTPFCSRDDADYVSH